MGTNLNPSGSAGHRERLRQSFLAKPEALSDISLVELLLSFSIPQRDVLPIAEELIERFQTLDRLLSASWEELCQVNGIKTTSSTLIKLVAHLTARRSEGNKKKRKESEKKPQQPSLMMVQENELFPEIPPEKTVPVSTPKKPSSTISLFGKAVFKETLDILPMIPETQNVEEVRRFLRKILHFSSEQTRQRYASYIFKRLFPSGKVDFQIIEFSKYFGKSKFLQEVAYFRFLKAEPIVEKVVVDVLLPAIGSGKVKRTTINEYLFSRFPESKSINDCTQGIVEVLKHAGLARVDRASVFFGYREIPLPSFAFILHDFYRLPSMFDLTALENNSLLKAMLWNPEKIKSSLISLRNSGLISRISEIDRVRQITIKYSFDQIIPEIKRAFPK